MMLDDDDESEMRARSAREDASERALAERIERLRSLWATTRKTWVSRLAGCEDDSDFDEWRLEESDWTVRQMCDTAVLVLPVGGLRDFLEDAVASIADEACRAHASSWARSAIQYGSAADSYRAAALFNVLNADPAHAASQSLARLLDSL